jgi:tetratricopeptide (TPR) repeat protein
MSKNFFKEDKEGFNELLESYQAFKRGDSSVYIDEESFESIIEYFNENEHYAEGLEAAEFAVAQFAYSSTLLILKADTLVSLRRFEEALFILDKAVLFDSQDPVIYIIKTDALLALNRFEEADEIFLEAIKKFDTEEKVNLLFELADVYDDYEIFDKVFDCLKMILKLDSENEEALYKICFWTDYTGRNEEGIKLHQLLIEKNPYNELAWFNLGAAYQGLKLYEKAIDAYQYAVAINEKFDYAYRNMGDAFIKLRKYKEAIEVLERVLELSIPESVIYEAIGHCFYKLNKFSQARFNYKKASHLNQEDSQLHYKIACTYMGEEKWENAIKSLLNAIKFHIMQPEYNLAIGKCYIQTGDFDEAIVHLSNVVRVRPKNTNGWIELLNCFYFSKQSEDGYEYASHAYEITGSKPVFLFYKVAFLLELGKSKDALLYLEQALSNNPNQIKFLIEINPSVLQNQQIVDLIARYKKKSSKKK